MQKRLSVRLAPHELAEIDATAHRVIGQLYMGTLDDEGRNTIAAAINIAWCVCESVPRHQHLLPVIGAANDAALAGYGDVAALDDVMRIYTALCRTTPRKALRRAIQRAMRAQEMTT